jgi:hypothetical protein
VQIGRRPSWIRRHGLHGGYGHAVRSSRHDDHCRFGGLAPRNVGAVHVKPLPRLIEARIVGIHAKKTAGLDRARELLRTLPPEVSIKLDQKELKTGIAIMNKKKMPDKAVIQSPGDGMYCWNGSNAMTGPEILERIAQLARM